MILTAHQPAYLPWLGYLHKIAISDEFVTLDKVQFEKNSFTNRNKIKTPNGAIWLTIPVHLAGHTTKTIAETLIDNNTDWRANHWRSILLNYKKAPYFQKYSNFLEDMYRKEWGEISSICLYLLTYLLKELNIKTKILKQSSLKTRKKKQDLILELCRKRKADKFVFGEMGKEYVDPKLFKKENIDIIFQKYKHPQYTQLWGNFVPNLSSLDSLLNIGPERTYDIIFQNNITKENIKI